MATQNNARENVLLTLDDVAGWRQEREEIVSQIEELQRRAEMVEKRLQHASFFLDPSDGVPDVVPDIDKPPSGARAEEPRPVTKRDRGGLITPMPMPELVFGLFGPDSEHTFGTVLGLVKATDGVGGPEATIKNNVYTSLKRLTDRKRLSKDEAGIFRLVRE